jgi:hypothetical protein
MRKLPVGVYVASAATLGWVVLAGGAELLWLAFRL